MQNVINKLPQKEIVKLYNEQQVNGLNIAKRYNCSYSVIYTILHKHGVKTRGRNGGKRFA